MKITHRFFVTLTMVTLLFATGCQTVDSRIKQKPAAFAGLDAATQEKIRRGAVELGFTPDMVWLALGRPDEKRESVDADGRSEAWIYRGYSERFEGTVMTGYAQHVVLDPVSKKPIAVAVPVYEPVFSQQRPERLRVIFMDGHVTAIERTK